MRQIPLQPSPLVALPSSQVSPAWNVELPQTNVHALGWPEQLHPPSI
jgi:hypothetical protein